MINRIKELRAAGITFLIAMLLTIIASVIYLFAPTLYGDAGIFLFPQFAIAISAVIGVFLAGKGFRHTLSLKKPRVSDILLSALMAIVILPASIYLASLFIMLIEYVFGQTIIDSALSGNVQAPWLSILIMCVAPALFEEAVFRGVIFKGLSQNYSIRKAIILSALFFGLFHMDFQRLISQTLLGALCAFVLHRSGSIFTSITVHFVNNAVAVSVSLLQQSSLGLAAEEVASTSMLEGVRELAAEFGLSMSVMMVLYIIICLIFIGISLALTYLLMRVFTKRTRVFHEDKQTQYEPPTEPGELPPSIHSYDADEAYLRSKRRAAWSWFVPGFAIVLISYLLVALTLSGLVSP